jgi:hypothetical protein
MKKCIDKVAIGNILHKLWKKDTGFENIDIAIISYNRALQDVQCEMDALEVQEEPVSEDLEKAAKQYSFYIPTQCEATETWKKETEQHFIDGAKWKNKNLWKPAYGENLPKFEQEVIVLTQPYPLEGSEFAVSFAHRSDSKGWNGKSLVTGKVEHYTPKTYGRGGWNIPNVKWWLGCSLPNMEED